MGIKRLSIFQKNLLLTMVITSLFGVVLFCSSIYVLTNHLTKNIIQQATELGDTWIPLMGTENIERSLSDLKANSPHNIQLIDQLTLLTENNENVSQAYLFGANINKNNETIILPQPKKILDLGYKIGELQKQPIEWVNAAKKLLRTKQPTHTLTYSDALGTWVTTLHPVMNNKGEVIAILGIDIDASIVEDGKKSLIYLLAPLLLLFIGITMWFQYLGQYKLFKPLNQLLNGINQVSKGDFKSNIPVTRKDEIGLLTESFNTMVCEIRLLFDSLLETASSIQVQSAESPDTTETSLNNSLELAFKQLENINYYTSVLERIQHADKMNAISQLAAAVAHEVRNPCTTINGFLQFFLEEDWLPDSKRGLIEVMKQEVDYIEKIISEYIQFSNPHQLNSQNIDISEKINKLIELVAPVAHHKVVYNTIFEEPLHIKANEIEMTQVFLNVLQNAVEAMPSGGTLTIKGYRTDDYVTIEVSDTGSGMSKEELSRLGTPFYSTKSKGTGLGLMTVYHIIRKYQGEIKVKSTMGIGTVFTVKIPLETKQVNNP
ncbi:HAMP domain-containing sensor histidine kinase [Fictibacillus sp. BK138]|uniref:HAMP domain-containing sensor histidine kinase n=1 Tax=Fictibacillus sp. BK138 TaxID=2512121 RepID=UPI001029FC6D|nr:HAMP domain-containing sensor histidine kinase [Fictibacillus sp. BK138]RZT15502.1 signal transduction histidine kinase [Fictibacillus sp. BK138]